MVARSRHPNGIDRNMNQLNVIADKITRPIQLLTVWLLGLTAVNYELLNKVGAPGVAESIDVILVAAAALNVIITFLCFMILFTRFRPELQDDTHYAEYVNKKTQPPRTDRLAELEDRSKQLAETLQLDGQAAEEGLRESLVSSEVESLVATDGFKRTLFELYVRPTQWPKVVSQFGHTRQFELEMAELVRDGLVELSDHSAKSATLTELGKLVAQAAQDSGALYTPPVR